MSPIVGLVVPSLCNGGGVPAVARFIHSAAERSGRYAVRPISLAMDSRDGCSRRIIRPTSWFSPVGTSSGTWNGLPMTHVGATWAELEFQRYRRRSALDQVLAGCDLIQVVCGSPAWANAVLGLGIPISLQVATRARVERRVRDASPRTVRAWWRKVMTEITDRLDDRGLRNVDAIQVENPWMLDYVRKLNANRPDVDIRYAPPGIDAEKFQPAPDRRTFVEPYVLCVGRLSDPRKNINLLLEAFLRISETNRDVRLVTAGSSPPPDEFWNRVTTLGLTERVSHVAKPSNEELVRLYQGATAFALPSDEEGLGVVVLEAMACGIPVVATRCGGPEGIIRDGYDGFLVTRDDVAGFASSLARLLSDEELNHRVGAAARKTIEARYALDVAGKRFIEVWDSLMTRERGNATVN